MKGGTDKLIAGIKHTVATPMSDADIKEYLPDAPIIRYAELSKYPTLHDLLPNVKDYVFLLYEDSPNRGHWVLVSRPEEGIAEYFDSYGGYVDAPLKWTPEHNRIALGAGQPLLSIMFDKCEEDVVYNKHKYQKDGGHVNDCGRWCVLRALKMKAGLNLQQFYKYVLKEDKQYIGDKDAMVAQLVP